MHQAQTLLLLFATVLRALQNLKGLGKPVVQMAGEAIHYDLLVRACVRSCGSWPSRCVWRENAGVLTFGRDMHR